MNYSNLNNNRLHGGVIKVKKIQTGKLYAMKTIDSRFRYHAECKGQTYQILNELKILSNGRHKNLARLRDVYFYGETTYILIDWMYSNLADFTNIKGEIGGMHQEILMYICTEVKKKKITIYNFKVSLN